MRTRFLTHFASVFCIGLGLSAVAVASLTYVTRKGDSLSTVAAQFIPGRGVWGQNGSLAEVLALNPQIANPDLIYRGQKINLPGGERTPSPKNSLVKAQTALRGVASSEMPSSEVPAGAAPGGAVPGGAVPAPTTEKNSSDGSGTSVELTPLIAMTSISSKDVSSGVTGTLASNIYVGIDARYVQSWNENFKTFLRGKLSYISFAPSLRNNFSLAQSSKFLTSFGLGASRALSPRFSVSGSFDLEQSLFVRAASTTSIAIDSVLIPSFGIRANYDFVKLNAFILGASIEYAEKMKATTDAYGIGLGSLYGGTIEVRQQKRGQDVFSVNLGANVRSQNTTFTDQTETLYCLSLRLFFNPSPSDKEGEPAK